MNHLTKGVTARLTVLRKLLPATTEDLLDARPGLWPRGGGTTRKPINGPGYRKLFRDLARVGAVRRVPKKGRGEREHPKAIWRLP